jgi:uncharacterized membrane protein HdeD (DUF308 family)
MIARTASDKAVPWWAVLIEGIALLVLGVLLLANTGETMLLLVQVLGLYWLVAGIIRIVQIFIDSTNWGWKLVGGLVGVIAGVLVLQHPLWSPLIVARALVIVIAIQGIVFGAIEIVAAFQGGGWGIGILGAVSVLIGIVLLVNPEFALWVPITLGIIAIGGGLIALVDAFRRRGATA